MRPVVLALLALLAVAARAADPADEMSLMLVRNSFFADHPALVPGDSNGYGQMLIDQAGSGNLADVESRAAAHSQVNLQQQGDGNAAGLFQADGAYNMALVQQQGNANYLAGTQSGAGNNAQVSQLSDGNRLRLDQQNGLNNANVTQNGYSVLTLQQGGGSSATITVDPGTVGAPIGFTLVQPPGDVVNIAVHAN